MTDALTEVQHGGRHYKGMKIQPIEFGYVNRYDDCAFSVMKYISRHRNKDGALDLDKASHFVDLRVQLIDEHGESFCCERIPVWQYVEENGIPSAESHILHLLHFWARGKAENQRDVVEVLKGLINELKIKTYGEESNVTS